MKDKKRLIRNIIIVTIIACLITLITVLSQLHNGKNIFNALCDGFFVASVILLCLGIMVWAAGLGSFYGINYMFYSIVSLFTLRKSRFEDKKSYYDFRMEKERKGKSNPSSLIIVGVVWFVISLIFLVLFNKFR